ncbi:hypothetical protein [Nostoc sp.]
MKIICGHTSWVLLVAFSPNSNTLASSSSSCLRQIHDDKVNSQAR